MTILAVTGLAKEAQIVGVADVVAVAGGGDAVSLASKLNALHGDIRGVISIGLAGALSPHLKVGDVVIADQILTGMETWDCHETWRVRLMSRLTSKVSGEPSRRPFRARPQPAAGGPARDFRRCVPCAAAGGSGGDEAGRRHRAGPCAGLACEKADANPGADPHRTRLEQGVCGTTPLPRSLWCWNCRRGYLTASSRHDARR